MLKLNVIPCFFTKEGGNNLNTSHVKVKHEKKEKEYEYYV